MRCPASARPALAALETARSRLRDCQSTAAAASPSITTDDPRRIAAVISAAGQQVMHEYVLAHSGSSTIVELAMWSSLPRQVDWPAVADAQVLDAMRRHCAALISDRAGQAADA
jgi:hypothetical protein